MFVVVLLLLSIDVKKTVGRKENPQATDDTVHYCHQHHSYQIQTWTLYPHQTLYCYKLGAKCYCLTRHKVAIILLISEEKVAIMLIREAK